MLRNPKICDINLIDCKVKRLKKRCMYFQIIFLIAVYSSFFSIGTSGTNFKNNQLLDASWKFLDNYPPNAKR